MKKVYCICVVLLAVLLSACGGREPKMNQTQAQEETPEDVEITLWTYPVGNWANLTAVSSLISGFQRQYPHVRVKVECLTYDDGDQKIRDAVQNGNVPDLVLEGPERMVADWGEQGLLADLSDLWESETGRGIYEAIRKACMHRNGAYYIFPLCMTAHCMAINYDLFEESGALQYIDEETHTWTTEGFVKAVQALSAHGQKRVGAIYCKNQSGDQGTRALVHNLCGGSFTDAAHSRYTVDSKENKAALQLLYDLEGIDFEPTMTSADEIAQFCRGELAMAFCWNASIETTQIIQNQDLQVEIFPMAFPVGKGKPRLESGIWGFGIFDNGDDARIEAAKTFIRYMTENEAHYTRAVLATAFWPVRDLQRDIYENDLLMTEYGAFMPYVGDYYQITPGWAGARAEWWKMLQKIGDGEDIGKAVREFSGQVNKAEK
ncbi:MAG: extracellular solute-binding protein [Eubacterium sp.]|nr:extracellular solute-binding protein [Eubacterium sp.]